MCGIVGYVGSGNAKDADLRRTEKTGVQRI